MTPTGKGRTLEEYHESLRRENPTEYAAIQEVDNGQARLEAELAAESAEVEKDLLHDLGAVGVHVTSAWDLVNTDDPYPQALPILLDHLHRNYPDEIREGIARALAVKKLMRPAWAEVVALYQEETASSSAKLGLAVALARIADSSVMGELLELASDNSHGESRAFFVRTLARSSDPKIQETLFGRLSTDGDLEVEIERIAKSRRARKSRARKD